jgi:hypothetical protein
MPPTPIDFDLIGTGIAARYAPGQVTPPAGLGNIRVATSDLPNALTVLPAVTVMPDKGSLSPGNGSRLTEADYLVRFHYSVARNLARDMNACRKWLGILIDQLRVGETVGASSTGVAVVRVLTFAIRDLPYGSRTYYGIELGVRATITSGWSA